MPTPAHELASAAQSVHLASGIALTMEHAQQLAARPQATASIALTMDDALALARQPASRAGLPPEPAAAVLKSPPGNIALTMKHAAALAAAPEFRHGIALTTEHAQALAKSPTARAGIAMTLGESVALAEAGQKSAAIAMTMDDALALAGSPGSRAGLELYDRSSPDLITNQRLSPEAIRAVLGGGHPVSTLGTGGTGASGPSSGAQKPQTGQFGKPADTLPVPLPLRVANALWTSIDVPQGLHITDIAAGTYGVTAPGGGVLSCSAIWAIGEAESGAETIVCRLVDGARLQEQKGMVATDPAASRGIAAARDTGEPFGFQVDGEVWAGSAASSAWQLLVGAYPGIVDMAVGRLADPYDPEMWWVDQGGTLYQVKLEGQAPNLHSVNVPVRGNTARVSIDVDGNLWTVSRDGHLGLGGSFQDLTPPGGARDVAAVPGGDVYVIGAQRASGMMTKAGFVPSAGNEIWFWNHLTKTWSLIPGWGVAIDVDNDGNLWVVDENGKVWNRGGRNLGFWEMGLRERPGPDQGWCDYINQDLAEVAAAFGDPTAFAQSIVQGKPLPSLVQEVVDRVVAGGATAIRIGQVSRAPDGGDPKGAITEPIELLVAAVLGLDVFVLFDVVRTNLRVVPDQYMSTPFDAPAFKAWFKGEFSQFHQNVVNLFSKFGVAQRFEDVIKYISIGGEVDVYLLGRPSEWDPWADFYHDASAHVRTLAPRVKIGCVMTLHYGLYGAWGFYNQQKPRLWLEQLNQASDFLGFTSYPEQNFPLDHPAIDGKAGSAHNYSVAHRIEQMLEIAGDKPVIIEEFGYPTYDDATIAALQSAWPQHSFPASFFAQYSQGEPTQYVAVVLAFEAWDQARLRLPLFIWFTIFEQHIEGVGCQCAPWQVAVKTTCSGTCNPCLPSGQDDPLCHVCGLLDGEDTLGTGTDERGERFFGSCGLVRSNGKEKSAWVELADQAAERRVPRVAP